MTKQQAAYELRHFRNAPRAENDRRQRWVLDKWQFRGAPGIDVLEIGPGPYGGCLPLIEAARRVALDPLWNDYAMAGILDVPAMIYGFAGYIEDAQLGLQVPGFDAVLCFNVLEHGSSSFASIDYIAPLLKPGGRFYLEQSLREEAQLNEAHTHVMRVEDLNAAVTRNRLRTIRQWIEPPQPDFDYSAVLSIYEAPEA